MILENSIFSLSSLSDSLKNKYERGKVVNERDLHSHR